MIYIILSGTDNRWAVTPRGKSGLRRAGCRITSGRGDSKESATENKPPVTYVSGKGEKVV